MIPDLYSALECSPSASTGELRSAYHRIALASHPDLHPNDSAAAERFRLAAEAWATLSDSALRAEYDAELARPEPARPEWPPTGHATTSAADIFARVVRDMAAEYIDSLGRRHIQLGENSLTSRIRGNFVYLYADPRGIGVQTSAVFDSVDAATTDAARRRRSILRIVRAR